MTYHFPACYLENYLLIRNTSGYRLILSPDINSLGCLICATFLGMMLLIPAPLADGLQAYLLTAKRVLRLIGLSRSFLRVD